MAEKRTKKVASKDVVTGERTVNPVEKKVAESKVGRKSWSVDSLFWGLLLVTIGALLLLGNMGVIDFRPLELWRLWPLLIVAAGLSLLSTRNIVWKLLSVLFVIVALAAVIFVGTGRYEMPTRSVTDQRESVLVLEGVEQADIKLSAGASNLVITSGDIAEVIDAKLKSSTLKLVRETEREGSTQRVTIKSENDTSYWVNPGTNEWDVVVTERLPVKLELDAGASSTDVDLSRVRVQELKVNAGASSSVITLGSKEKDVKVSIDAGASSFTLRVPASSGINLLYDGGLSSKDLGGLRSTGDKSYRSDNYEAAPNKIDITVDAGLASFTLERY